MAHDPDGPVWPHVVGVLIGGTLGLAWYGALVWFLYLLVRGLLRALP
jgi:hypothetical protein